MSATGDSIASGGDYVTFGSVVMEYGFNGAAAGASWTHPVSGVYVLTYEHAWASFSDGGTIGLEIDGAPVPGGTLADATTGQSGQGTIAYRATAESVGSIKVTQASGLAQTCDAVMWLAITDSTGDGASSGTYSEAVLADGPIAYWRMDETSGTSAADSTGNGHTGTYAGGVTLGAAGVMVDGSGSPSADFDGSTGYVGGTDWADLEFTGTAPFSVEAWVVADGFPAPPSTFALIVGKQASAGGQGWELLYDADSHAIRFMRAGTAVPVVFANPATSTRYHLVGVYDGSTVSLFVNGTLVDSAADPNSQAATAAPLGIGQDSASTAWYWDGRIDEVAIYGLALTATQVQNHYTIGIGGV